MIHAMKTGSQFHLCRFSGAIYDTDSTLSGCHFLQVPSAINGCIFYIMGGRP